MQKNIGLGIKTDQNMGSDHRHGSFTISMVQTDENLIYPPLSSLCSGRLPLSPPATGLPVVVHSITFVYYIENSRAHSLSPVLISRPQTFLGASKSRTSKFTSSFGWFSPTARNKSSKMQKNQFCHHHVIAKGKDQF